MRDLTDAQWAILQPLLPPRNRTGRPRANDRRTVNAILCVLRTGCAWRDLPEKYGDDSTAHRRLQRWQQEGIWQRIHRTTLTAMRTGGGPHRAGFLLIHRDEVERYRREHLGKRGVGSPSHPLFGKGRPRKKDPDG
jgi:transposase